MIEIENVDEKCSVCERENLREYYIFTYCYEGECRTWKCCSDKCLHIAEATADIVKERMSGANV